ncbi:MAG: glycosyltransferase, partial [Candidatus Hydrogenedentes bacterium]|nr:glycosyltransferase [Candidatus Hydrogenedentota bacterium]
HADGAPVKFRVFRAGLTGVAAARNVALREGRGRWVLFLDAELLASPKLVESHVRAQDQHGGNCAIIGHVAPHPQAERAACLRHFAAPGTDPFVNNQPLRFLDWRCWNLSAPRTALLDAQGFDESFAAPGLEDIELAWRLERAGMYGYFGESAVAYAWQPMDVDRELARRYFEGFTLHRVLSTTHSDVLANRYLGPGVRPWSTTELVLAPVYQRVCHAIAVHAGPFDWVCRRMARTAVVQGFRDARRGKPPRYRAGV